jgi:DNA-binding NarL/FixJ family response regulator
MLNPPKVLKTLIVDDHPFIILGYKNVMKLFPNKKFEFEFTEAVDCKTGYETIMNAVEPFDIAFLDISMPPYEEKNILTGKDLAKLLRIQMPSCKIVILTMHSERLEVESSITDFNPEGLIIKNDLTYSEMTLAIKTLLKEEKYYSAAVIKYLNSLNVEKIYVDVFDRQILHFLNKGIIASDVALYIPISSAEVKDRIKKMKILIDKKACKNSELLETAKERGMLVY